jgi:hypothetical protein
VSYEVVQVEHERNFSILDNSAARNPRLSLAARGLLWTLRSLPPGARTDSTSIAESCETKRDGTRTAFDLLEREGYVRRERVQEAHSRSLSCRFSTFPQVTPATAFPAPVKPTPVNPALKTLRMVL